MVGNVIDGKAVAARIRVELSAQVAVLKRDYGRVSGGWRHLITWLSYCFWRYGTGIPCCIFTWACMPCIPRGIVHSCGVAFMSPALTSPNCPLLLSGAWLGSRDCGREERQPDVRTHEEEGL